ncbi:MAG TPA: class I SAM-dependent methyltransferase [Xanthobacteraceae bacterium]|jgi:2-polyprenyl-3-methyl-5-hydroxy-6-metoxy-1,4-benzoquinol methylase
MGFETTPTAFAAAMRTGEPATYLVEGKHLTEPQCRALFAALPLLDRHIKVLDRIEGDTLVDVGCFSGAFVREASRRFPGKTITGVDYFEDNIRIARLLYPEIRDCYQQMSVYQLEFADATVDCVTLQETLEHLEGAALAIKEINRVLKTGGALIVSVPNPFYIRRVAAFAASEIGNALRRLLGRPSRLATEVLSASIEWDRHVYAWTPQTLLTLLASNGFAYVEHCYESNVPDRLRRWLLTMLPFIGPTQILKVRKVAPAPAKLV